MKKQPQTRLDLMGRLNNAIVEQIDGSQLTLPEVLAVLYLIADRMEQLFAIQVTEGRK